MPAVQRRLRGVENGSASLRVQSSRPQAAAVARDARGAALAAAALARDVAAAAVTRRDDVFAFARGSDVAAAALAAAAVAPRDDVAADDAPSPAVARQRPRNGAHGRDKPPPRGPRPRQDRKRVPAAPDAVCASATVDGRGDAAAVTRIFFGDESRRRRGRYADIQRRRVAATSRLRQSWDAAVETGLRSQPLTPTARARTPDAGPGRRRRRRGTKTLGQHAGRRAAPPTRTRASPTARPTRATRGSATPRPAPSRTSTRSRARSRRTSGLTATSNPGSDGGGPFFSSTRRVRVVASSRGLPLRSWGTMHPAQTSAGSSRFDAWRSSGWPWPFWSQEVRHF